MNDTIEITLLFNLFFYEIRKYGKINKIRTNEIKTVLSASTALPISKFVKIEKPIWKKLEKIFCSE